MADTEIKDRIDFTGEKCSDFKSYFFGAWDLTVIARKYLEGNDAGEHHELISVLGAIEGNLTEMSNIMFEADKENAKKEKADGKEN